MMNTLETIKNSGNTASEQISIVFFGSGPVAAKSLDLLRQSFHVEYVITKPRPAHHKGSVPVLELAEQLNIPLILTTDKQDLSAKITRQKFKSRVGVLIDFGIIVRQDVIDTFELGIVNSHFSLLPELRGADPISFSIINGLDKTGVSLMLLVEAMDEGPIIACGIEKLHGSETTPTLTQSLINLSDALLKKELPRYVHGEAKGVKQAELATLIEGYPSKASYSRKLTKDDSILDFNKSAHQLEREIRAFIEWPRSRVNLENISFIVTKAHVDSRQGDPDSLSITTKELLIHCSDGSLAIDEVIPPGKKPMAITSFLAGYASLLQ